MTNRLDDILNKNYLFIKNSFINKFILFLIIGFLISSAMVTNLNNFFAVILVLTAFILLAQGYSIELPSPIKYMILIGALLSGMVFLHAFFGRDINMLFKFQFENMRNLILLILFAIIVSKLKITAQLFWKTIIFTGLYTLPLVVLVYFEGAHRGHGWLEEAIKIGNFAILFLLIAIPALFGVKGWVWKIFALIVIVSGLLLSILSQTRAGWVAFIVAAFILLWSFYRLDKKYFYALFSILTLLILAVIFYWNELPIEKRYLQALNDVNRYFNEGFSNSSVGARLDMWLIAYHAFLDKPIFGWGVVPFKETMVSFIEQGVGNFQLKGVEGEGFAQPHNDYMFVLYHFGLVGFILVLTFLLTPVIYLINVIRSRVSGDSLSKQVILLSVAGLLALEALLDFMVFNLAFNNQILYVVLVIVFMAIFAIKNEQDEKLVTVSSNQKLKQV